MHPLGLYLVISDNQREHGHRTDDRRPTYAAVDAVPMTAREPRARFGRLSAIVRRRVTRTASA